jgi:hypothetical protein
VTSDPRAFLALDLGAATTSAALVARLGGRWRLMGSLALPAAVPPDVVVRRLVERTVAADAAVAARVGLDAAQPDRLPRVTVRSHQPVRIAVVAASDRALGPLVDAATRSGWDVVATSVQASDPLAMTRLLLDPTVEAILAGAGDPPGADERGALPELATLVAAIAERRPTLTIVLAGSLADELERFGDVGARPGEVLLGAAATGVRGRPLDELLTELALPPDDARRAAAVGVATLAEILGRRIETIEIGFGAGSRTVAIPGADDERAMETAVIADAALVPPEPDDQLVDRVMAWSTVAVDRHRLRDQLRELRITPWGDAAGDGAALRLSAARAAIGRLLEATPHLASAATPDLVIAAGGAWSIAPGPVVTLALADVLRRPGASQFAYDHARLLGPLGSVVDPDERRDVLADLADDMLVPLGSVVAPGGLRAGRSAGRLTVHGATGTSELDLIPGGLELVDLPPGQTAVAEFRFRDSVRLGARGKHFAVDVAGGLGGLLVDLRDVPLRLPERLDRRRELLAAWQGSMWAGMDG